MKVETASCESCGRARGERHKATMKRPPMPCLEQMDRDGVALATDGCETEPDAPCEHGHASWLQQIGVI